MKWWRWLFFIMCACALAWAWIETESRDWLFELWKSLSRLSTAEQISFLIALLSLLGFPSVLVTIHNLRLGRQLARRLAEERASFAEETIEYGDLVKRLADLRSQDIDELVISAQAQGEIDLDELRQRLWSAASALSYVLALGTDEHKREGALLFELANEPQTALVKL